MGTDGKRFVMLQMRFTEMVESFRVDYKVTVPEIILLSDWFRSVVTSDTLELMLRVQAEQMQRELSLKLKGVDN